jgi:hypothetical protein
MGKEADKRTKPAPPRPTDAARFAEFMRQTGLRSQFSAKQRRRLDRLNRLARRR